MEHKFGSEKAVPGILLINKTERQIDFWTHDMVMVDDTVLGNGVKGSIKEIPEERPARGRFSDKPGAENERPTWYRVQLY